MATSRLVSWQRILGSRIWLLVWMWLTALPCPAQSIRFSRDVQPILSKHCYACHGPDEKAREAGLALHDPKLAFEEADSGEPAIVPGQPEASPLWKRVVSKDESERMPPAEHGPALTGEQVRTLNIWIAEGAKFDLHWAYLPIQRPSEPEVQDLAWPKNSLDRFVLARLEIAGLDPEPPASRGQLLRRLAFDLTGLPPKPELLNDFLADDSEMAYERAVDRFLAEPTFGEHWARMWLDAARYADSQGYAQDEIRSIWKYRDWVIDAFNRDLPFDQFTMEQLAGDMLPQPTREQRIATAFHRNTMTNTEGGTDDEEFRHAAIVDRVNTTATVWLGTTVSCAQCHSHKFDPVSMEDYYGLFAIFNQTEDNDQPDNSPNYEDWTDEQLRIKTELTERIRNLDQQASNNALSEEQKLELEKSKQTLAEIRSITTPVMRELPFESQRKTRIAIRGSFLTPGEEVQPGVPQNLAPLCNLKVSNRLQLAHWLMASENPLTARVAVNRIWEQIFGQGIVASMEDFGSQGTPPSHPELLDWLADEFRRLGWSHKRLLRTIVLSQTYRQSSITSPQKLQADPSNRLFSRGARYRLSAEQIRDAALSISGLLSHKRYGPPVHPPQPKSGLSAAFGGSLDWEPSQGEDRYRRGIYTLWRRTNPYPSFMALDATNRTLCTVRRIRTNTPISAFVTLNDPVFVECAQGLARRVLAQQDLTHDPERIVYAYELTVARKPDSDEANEILGLLEKESGRYATDLALARQMIGGQTPVSDSEAPRLAAWVVVANVLLNLDETLTRN